MSSHMYGNLLVIYENLLGSLKVNLDLRKVCAQLCLCKPFRATAVHFSKK